MPITDTHKEVQKLLKEQKKFHKENRGRNYPDENGYSKHYSFAQEDLDDILSGDLTPLYATNVFKDLTRWYLANTVYELLEHNNQEKALDYYAKSAAYAYAMIALYVSEKKCENGADNGLWCDRVTELISRSLITGWQEEYVQQMEWIIEAINYGRRSKPDGRLDALFFATGSELCKTSWFLIDLYCNVYNREYNMDNAEHTDNMVPYNQVLEKWDTEDVDEVEKLVYLLCEHHIMQTEEEKTDEDYFAFNGFNYELYPYEILSWLALREHKDIHPLMNTPIARFFLSLQRPLSKPKQLPYVYPLLQEFKKLCPNLVIAEWINNVESSSEMTP